MQGMMFLCQEPQVVDACVLRVSVVGQHLHTRVHESISACMCYVRMWTRVLRDVRGWDKVVPHPDAKGYYTKEWRR